ncbi:FAD/NAD(P)-binding protein [Streptacidiphilus sp. EB129]|uniref:FAD/NAD(P)-binding protein n=1 Tax=Streptacidiphilus sp. EB129 TaxID=3156262 RepID=UPI003516D1A6
MTNPIRPLLSIAVVGAGAAGTLTAMRLLRHAAAHGGTSCQVWLIDPEPTGRGLAFGTDAPHHLLNVPAANMSAHWDEPDHFTRWLDRHGHGEVFAPRGLYGRYLADSLDVATELDGAPPLLRIHERVVGISHDEDADRSSLALRFETGQVLRADAAVLALGNFPPDQSWAPPALRDSARFVADPWAPGFEAAVAGADDVLLVGTGLTMVDIALTLQRPGRVVRAISRHGLVPQPHAASLPAPAETPHLDAHGGLADLRRTVLRHLARCRRTHGDWRPGVDSLRQVTSALWQQLPPADRSRFLRDDLRRWETHRHRIPPSSAAVLQEAVDTGRVTIGSGAVADATVGADGVRLVLADGRVLSVEAVVNCTGSQSDLTRVDDPLVTALLGAGLAVPAPVGGGFGTEADGRLLAAPDRAQAPLWTLGGLRRGDLLETTAIPEIRRQADALAVTLLSRTRTLTPAGG